MIEQNTKETSVSELKKSLKRLEALLRGPNLSPADYAVRDRLARQLREAKKHNA